MKHKKWTKKPQKNFVYTCSFIWQMKSYLQIIYKVIVEHFCFMKLVLVF